MGFSGTEVSPPIGVPPASSTKATHGHKGNNPLASFHKLTIAPEQTQHYTEPRPQPSMWREETQLRMELRQYGKPTTTILTNSDIF